MQENFIRPLRVVVSFSLSNFSLGFLMSLSLISSEKKSCEISERDASRGNIPLNALIDLTTFGM